MEAELLKKTKQQVWATAVKPLCVREPSLTFGALLTESVVSQQTWRCAHLHCQPWLIWIFGQFILITYCITSTCWKLVWEPIHLKKRSSCTLRWHLNLSLSQENLQRSCLFPIQSVCELSDSEVPHWKTTLLTVVGTAEKAPHLSSFVDPFVERDWTRAISQNYCFLKYMQHRLGSCSEQINKNNCVFRGLGASQSLKHSYFVFMSVF